jgi:glutathione peroxidase
LPHVVRRDLSDVLQNQGESGQDKHPLYTELVRAEPRRKVRRPISQESRGHGIAANPEPEVLWNFEKFIVGATGP